MSSRGYVYQKVPERRLTATVALQAYATAACSKRLCIVPKPDIMAT